MKIQISCESGFINEKIPGFFLAGFLIMMLMPRDINGLVKSMTLSLKAVIVNGAIAISASYQIMYFYYHFT